MHFNSVVEISSLIMYLSITFLLSHNNFEKSFDFQQHNVGAKNEKKEGSSSYYKCLMTSFILQNFLG